MQTALKSTDYLQKYILQCIQTTTPKSVSLNIRITHGTSKAYNYINNSNNTQELTDISGFSNMPSIHTQTKLIKVA